MTKKTIAKQEDFLSGKWDELNEDFNSSKRIIYLENSIDFSTISFITQRVDLICNITGNSKDPITLELSTYGGDALALFGIIDTIRLFKMPISILGRGAVMSAGAILLATTTGERLVTKNTYVMFHSISTGIDGSMEDIEIEASNVKDISLRVYALLAASTKKDESFWSKSCKKNYYLTPEKCLEFGVIDKII